MFYLDNSIEALNTLNTVMIDHLTNDMHIYEQVCLNVRDIQELKLIRLPSTFHESKAKLYAIDPCLVDIRLSPSDEHERMSNESINETQLPPPPIARRPRKESLGSNGGGTLISSSSNESTSSLGYRSNENYYNKSLDEPMNKFSRLSIAADATTNTSKPVTLLAKKVLPKKIERNNFRPVYPQNHFDSTQINPSNILKKIPLDNRRKASPIRVTITSKLNPNAAPFYAQQRSIPSNQNSSFTFYERNRFQPRLQPVISPDRSQSINSSVYQQQNHHRSRQRFIPPRQMVIKKNFNLQQPSVTTNHPVYSSSFFDKRSYPQQPSKHKTTSHEQIPGDLFHLFFIFYFDIFDILGLMRQTSSTIMDQILSTPPIRERLSVPISKRTRQSPAILSSTGSLPYQPRHSGDFNHLKMALSFGEPIGSHREKRTISGTSSGSSLSVDIGPHSIVQFDSTSNALTSTDGQYDFEKANDEFRRYLELEELVTRRASSVCSTGSPPDENSNHQQAQTHSYKKEISFFDRISCTATTGTAVAYTEMDEVEKNLETFGDDALLIKSDLNDNEWQI